MSKYIRRLLIPFVISVLAICGGCRKTNHSLETDFLKEIQAAAQKNGAVVVRSESIKTPFSKSLLDFHRVEANAYEIEIRYREQVAIIQYEVEGLKVTRARLKEYATPELEFIEKYVQSKF